MCLAIPGKVIEVFEDRGLRMKAQRASGRRTRREPPVVHRRRARNRRRESEEPLVEQDRTPGHKVRDEQRRQRIDRLVTLPLVVQKRRGDDPDLIVDDREIRVDEHRTIGVGRLCLLQPIE